MNALASFPIAKPSRASQGMVLTAPVPTDSPGVSCLCELSAVSGPIGTPRESQLLARGGFGMAVAVSAESPVDGQLTRDVAVSDLAVRVLRAAECLDDPTTSLLANLDTLLDDLREGHVNLADAEELVADCVLAVTGLASGLERIKHVAAPHLDIIDHQGEVSIDRALRDAVQVHRTPADGLPVDLPAITGLRSHGDRPSLGHAFADLLEVFACRISDMPDGRVAVSASRAEGRVCVRFTDGGGPFPELAADLLSGCARADSQEGLALLAARSLFEALGAEVRVGLVDGKGAIEVHLREVRHT